MQLETFRNYIHDDLERNLLKWVSHDSRLENSMHYSLSNGGKRLRPLMVLATLFAFKNTYKEGVEVACAIEYVHTYSLIHDDLPAMDNDDYRRGALTNHKKFDEATAILAGDALLTLAFEVISQSEISPEQRLKLIENLAKASGKSGMVLGQINDIQFEKQKITLSELKAIHEAKTGALIQFSLMSGALLAGGSDDLQAMILQFAKHYGVAFQIQNDLQEVLWTEAQRGKKSHHDEESGKNTYPALLGTQEAIKALNDEIAICDSYLRQIKNCLPDFDEELMRGFLKYLSIVRES